MVAYKNSIYLYTYAYPYLIRVVLFFMDNIFYFLFGLEQLNLHDLSVSNELKFKVCFSLFLRQPGYNMLDKKEKKGE